MVAIRSRWRDGGILEVPPGAPVCPDNQLVAPACWAIPARWRAGVVQPSGSTAPVGQRLTAIWPPRARAMPGGPCRPDVAGLLPGGS